MVKKEVDANHESEIPLNVVSLGRGKRSVFLKSSLSLNKVNTEIPTKITTDKKYKRSSDDDLDAHHHHEKEKKLNTTEVAPSLQSKESTF